jgi:hypothetical protein
VQPSLSELLPEGPEGIRKQGQETPGQQAPTPKVVSAGPRFFCPWFSPHPVFSLKKFITDSRCRANEFSGITFVPVRILHLLKFQLQPLSHTRYKISVMAIKIPRTKVPGI